MALLEVEKPSGEIVFKIFELAQGATKRSKFNKRFGITDREFKRFSAAVHDPAVSGDWARHGFRPTSKLAIL
jgi:hypothetical protein